MLTPNSIAKTHADGHASVEELITDGAEAFRKRLKALLGSANGRIPELWKRAEADLYMTYVDYQAVPVASRGTEWLSMFTSMVAAAQWQAWLETFGAEVLRKTEKYGNKTQELARDMSLDELKDIATVGFTREGFDDAKVARKQRTVTNGAK
jgi:hypothetical protein